MKIKHLTKRAAIILAVLLTPFFMMSCNQNSSNPKEVAAQKIDSLFNSLYNEGEPGGSVMIMKGDDVFFAKSYGIADMETKAPIDANTFFNIASVSKQFTAMAILKLHQEGKLSLEDNIKKYFPEFKGDFFERIRIKHLLSQCSRFFLM